MNVEGDLAGFRQILWLGGEGQGAGDQHGSQRRRWSIEESQFIAKILANGGFGPGVGLLGLAGGYPDPDGRAAVVRYEWLRGQGWREHLLPAFDWGDGAWSCVDLSTPNGLIVTADDVGFTATRFDVESWFKEWLSGTPLHDKSMRSGRPQSSTHSRRNLRSCADV